MSRKKKSLEQMFNEFQQLSLNIRALSGIVQNEGVNVSDDEMQEWIDIVHDNINKLNSLKEDVVRFYKF